VYGHETGFGEFQAIEEAHDLSPVAVSGLLADGHQHGQPPAHRGRRLGLKVGRGVRDHQEAWPSGSFTL
jgi:hypothetical protein